MATKDDKGNLHSESNGQFVSKEEQETKRQEAEKIYNSEPTPTEPQNDDADRQDESLSIDELLGEEFKGYKGQKAISKLLQEKRGYVKGAFHRDDIGDIDLLWGNDFIGLRHIIKQREAQGINISDFMKDLSSVIEEGRFRKKTGRGDFEFVKDGKLAVIAIEYHGNKMQYLLTAYKTRYK